MLVARTNWEVPKHRGLTFFALPMHQEGVEVQRIKQMNLHSSFCEVILTDARIPKANVVGEIGDGWSAALTALTFERRFQPMSRPYYRPEKGRVLEEARIEAADHFETFRWYPQRAGRVDLIIEHARSVGRSGDPLIRQDIGEITRQWNERECGQ